MYNFLDLPDNFLHRKYTPQEKTRFDAIINKTIDDNVSEELTPKQKKKVDSWDGYKNNPLTKLHDSAFGKGVDRVVIPYDDSDEEKITTKNRFDVPKNRGNERSFHSHILGELSDHGYKTADYLKGTVSHESTPDKEVKIDSALKTSGIDKDTTPFFSKPKFARSETGEMIRDKHGNGQITEAGKPLNMSQAYAADPVRAAAKSKKQIVITRNPYDVAGMSTDRGWNSCMHMEHGCNKKYLPKDIEHQTLTAYMTKVPKEGSSDVSNPMGRINLKRFDSQSHSMFRPEGTTYGTIPKNFHKTVSIQKIQIYMTMMVKPFTWKKSMNCLLIKLQIMLEKLQTEC
jgi:hypothetical protein